MLKLVSYTISYFVCFNNILLFILMGLDKSLAVKKKRRISEKTLLTISLFGGSLGGIIGMLVFRHKTKKNKFIITFMFSLVVWIYILLYIKQTSLTWLVCFFYFLSLIISFNAVPAAAIPCKSLGIIIFEDSPLEISIKAS